MFRMNPFKVSLDGGSGMTKLFQLALHLPAIGRGCWKHDIENSEVSARIGGKECQRHLVTRCCICNVTLRWNCALSHGAEDC